MSGEESEFSQPLVHPRGALRHRVVRRLLAKIIRGEFAPGTRLISNALAHQLGVSATPVREALVELEQCGLVALAHHRGAVVNPFGRGELRDFYHVRSLLQCDAVRLTCGHIATPRLDALHDEAQRLRDAPREEGRCLKDVFFVDQHIRQILVDHCPNKRLSAELGRHDSIDCALRELAQEGKIVCREALLPAVDLAAALRQKEAKEGSRAMRRHVRVIAGAVETVVFNSRS
jgi:DNA-binding GntR family transcriptional regulator